MDRARLKKQGVIKTTKGGDAPAARPPPPQRQAAAAGNGEGPNVGLIAAAVLVPLALWLVLSGGQ